MSRTFVTVSCYKIIRAGRTLDPNASIRAGFGACAGRTTGQRELEKLRARGLRQHEDDRRPPQSTERTKVSRARKKVPHHRRRDFYVLFCEKAPQGLFCFFVFTKKRLRHFTRAGFWASHGPLRAIAGGVLIGCARELLGPPRNSYRLHDGRRMLADVGLFYTKTTKLSKHLR